MGASITLAGESLIAQKQGAGEKLEIARFVLALVPGLDPNAPVDRAAGKPPSEQIVFTKAYDRKGYVSPNQVIYSLSCWRSRPFRYSRSAKTSRRCKSATTSPATFWWSSTVRRH
jgi:hypothetical protein